jgi:hypothetical protein
MMKIGMLLHTFADTYAHQLFSGYNNPQNAVSLVEVINNSNNRVETDKYKSRISDFLYWLSSKGLPSVQIGHMSIMHIPDLTHLSFTMDYPVSRGGTERYARSNTSEFVLAGREIVDYLRSCLNQGRMPEDQWGRLSGHLSACFLWDISEYSDEQDIVEFLADKWKLEFPELTYAYDHTDIFDGIVGGSLSEAEPPVESLFPNMEDDFYRFNCFAEDLLIRLYERAKPRDTYTPD